MEKKKVFFIKLGSGGCWNKECIDKGIIKIDFREVNFADIISNKWDKIREHYAKQTSSPVASMYTNQIKNFYEADGKVLWIIFYNQKLWWCQAKGPIYENADKTKYRRTIKGWSSKNITGKDLLMNNLGGTLLAVQGFRSTICRVPDSSYVINKINNEQSPDTLVVEKDFNQLSKSIGKLIANLTWKDFELLVDLIFREMGCQRISVIGGPQKTIDIELFSPVINERYLVQVKAKTNLRQYEKYREELSMHVSYNKCFYVYHTTDDKKLENYLEDSESNIIIWRVKEISEHAINAGLVSWLINKAG